MYTTFTEIRTIECYHDRDWAIHSAQCQASFFGCTVYVLDVLTGEVIYVAN